MALKDLSALSKAVPGLNEQAQQRAQAAANVQLQQQLGSAPRQTPVKAGSQQGAAAQMTQMGKIAAQTQANQQQQQAAIGQQALQQQQAQGAMQLQQRGIQQREQLAGEQQQQRIKLSDQEIASRKRLTNESLASAQRVQQMGLEYDNKLSLLSERQIRDLSRIGRDVKQKIFDSRMSFDRDEMGRKFSNERQLADYAIMTARSEEDLSNKMQQMQQQSQRKVQMMEVGYKKIINEMKRQEKMSEGQKNFEQLKMLGEMSRNMRDQINRENQRAANKSAMIGAASTIVGVGVAAAGGGPVGGALASGATTAVLSGF